MTGWRRRAWKKVVAGVVVEVSLEGPGDRVLRLEEGILRSAKLERSIAEAEAQNPAYVAPKPRKRPCGCSGS